MSHPLPNVLELVGELLELPAAKRDARLSELCAGNESLRDEAMTLLAEMADAETEAEATRPSPAVEPRDAIGGSFPEQLGNYRIIRVIGRGGMGEVYEAEQQRPRRLVALKIIHPHLVSRAVLKRFEYEAEVLGRLEHPGIARIYEAGTANGPRSETRPFFAMELVRGQRLTDWVATHKPDLRRRLLLLIDICQAVQHAHQHGVIHRDLKPSNILVTDAGQPKVLDFGVARAVEGDGNVEAAATLHTESGALLGTLQYMSPEQAVGDARRLDTRSDVYALGIIAYQLLADRLPYDVSNKLLPDALRIICEEEPTRLSTFNRELRGDLETIVLKALAKEKQHRYASSAELAADVRHYLEYEPIAARPPSARYQFAKLLRRHPAASVAAAALVLMLFLGVIGMSVALTRVNRARLTAESARQASDEVHLFFNRMLWSVDPSEAGGKQVLVREVLDKAAAELKDQFKSRPAVEVALRHTIGGTYLALGVYDEAIKQLRQALELHRATAPDDQVLMADLQSGIAQALQFSGKHAEAESLARETAALSERVNGKNAHDTITALSTLALALEHQDRPAEAEPIHREIIAREAAREKPDVQGLLTVKDNFAVFLLRQGRFAESEAILRESLSKATQAFGAESRPAMLAAVCLGSNLATQGKPQEAEQLLAKALPYFEKSLPPDHPDALDVAAELVNAISQQPGRAAESEQRFRDLAARLRRVRGPDHEKTLEVELAVVRTLVQQGRHADALPEERQLLERFGHVIGPERSRSLVVRMWLIDSLVALGRLEEAEQAARQGADLARHGLGEKHPDTISMIYSVGRVLRERKRPAEAQPFLEEVMRSLPEVDQPPDSVATFTAALGMCLAEQGSHQQAEPILLRARELAREAHPESSSLHAKVLRHLLSGAELMGRPADADKWSAELSAAQAATRPATRPAG